MTVFACDSSGRTASAAILMDNHIIAKELVDEGLTHSEMLMPLCDRVFKSARLSPDDIDYFSVSCGPGSFTGLRIGIGLIKGIALAADKPCIAVPTMEALALSCCGTDSTVIPVCDARRGRVFCSSFSGLPDVVRLTKDMILEIEKLPELFGTGANLFVGDASEMCYNYFRDRYHVSAGQHFVDSEYVARAAVKHITAGREIPAELLNPFYLQLSQAERDLQKAKGNIANDSVSK